MLHMHMVRLDAAANKSKSNNDSEWHMQSQKFWLKLAATSLCWLIKSSRLGIPFALPCWVTEPLRYAAGHLFDASTGHMGGLKPRHFITMATPHLGCAASGIAGVRAPLRASQWAWEGEERRMASVCRCAHGGWEAAARTRSPGCSHAAPCMSRQAAASLCEGGARG